MPIEIRISPRVLVTVDRQSVWLDGDVYLAHICPFPNLLNYLCVRFSNLELVPDPYRGLFQIPCLTDYKAIPTTAFQNLGRVSLSLSTRQMKGAGRSAVAMDQDASSAVSNWGQFDKSRWKAVQM